MAATRQTSRRRDTEPRAGYRGPFLAFLGLVTVIGLLVAWWFGWLRGGVDPRVVEIRKLRDEAAAKYRANGGPTTPAEATAMLDAMDAIQRRIEELPPDLQEEARRGGRVQAEDSASIDRYFATPPDKRVAELDRQIDRQMMVEKVLASRRNGADRSAGGGAASGAASGAGASAASGAASGAGPGGGGRRPATEEDRNRFRKSILDRTTPAQRARYVEHRRVLEERRQQRGLPASPWNR